MWLDMSALGLTPQRSALRTVVRPSSALHLAVGLSALWLDLPDRRSALHFVFCAYASSFGPLCCCSADRVVVGLTTWLFDRSHGHRVRHVVMRPFASSLHLSLIRGGLHVVVALSCRRWASRRRSPS